MQKIASPSSCVRAYWREAPLSVPRCLSPVGWMPEKILISLTENATHFPRERRGAGRRVDCVAVPPRSLAIVGTGLIGASVGLAAKRIGVPRVTGFDPDERALAVAAERGAVDEAAETLRAALAGAELAVVAAPVTQLGPQVAAVLAATTDETTVTDVGSTKQA